MTRADYERAQGLDSRLEPLAVNVAEPATWIGETHRFYYRVRRPEGFEFVQSVRHVGPSTLQVVSALMKANKNFDFLLIPGAEHNAGRGGEYGPYGERKRFDFFVRHLLGQNPPDWSAPLATRPMQ